MNQEDSEIFEKPKVLNLKLIKRGVVIFVVITIVTFMAIFLYTNTGKTIEVWQKADWRYLLLGLVFIFNDLFLGGLRNHIFIREFVPGISQLVSIKANLANIFMGEGFILHLTKFGFSVFTTLLVVIGVTLFAPSVMGLIISSLASGVKKISSSWGLKLSQLGEKGIEKIKEYKGKYIGLIQQKPQLMLYSFLLTITLYFNKYLLAYILLLAFGLSADFWTVIAIQAVLYLLLYFSPSPGGSGIAELSISALMATVVATEYIAPFTLLYRSFLIFIPALIGSYVILNQLRRE